MALIAMMAGTAAAADTIKIAYIDPLSGAFAGVGDAGYRHFQYSADLINAKGGILGGKMFEIVPFDNKVSPKEALIQLKLAIDQGIQIITQGNSSAVAGALIEAVDKHNMRNPDKLFFISTMRRSLRRLPMRIAVSGTSASTPMWI